MQSSTTIKEQIEKEMNKIGYGSHVISSVIRQINDEDKTSIEHLFAEACWYGYTDVIKAISNIENFDVNRYGSAVVTPLYWAAYQGHLDIVKHLIAKGADVNLEVNHQDIKTPIEIAAANKHPEVVYCLYKAGAEYANPNIKIVLDQYEADTIRKIEGMSDFKAFFEKFREMSNKNIHMFQIAATGELKEIKNILKQIFENACEPVIGVDNIITLLNTSKDKKKYLPLLQAAEKWKERLTYVEKTVGNDPSPVDEEEVEEKKVSFKCRCTIM